MKVNSSEWKKRSILSVFFVYEHVKENENGEVEEVLLDDSELTISGFSSTLFKIRFFYSKINVSGTF
ncbi:hypothetical protein ACFMB7_08155 [Bacillus toyonensis]